jgi:hypothetical protein
MTRTFQARFDGKAIIPETPVDLPQDQPLTVTIDSPDVPEDPAHGTVAYLMKHLRSTISDEDAELMRRAVQEADRDFEPSPDIKLD